MEWLILDVQSNPGFVSPYESKQYQKQSTRDVVLDRRSPGCEDLLKEQIGSFSDFVCACRGVRDPEVRYLAGNPRYPVAGQL